MRKREYQEEMSQENKGCREQEENHTGPKRKNEAGWFRRAWVRKTIIVFGWLAVWQLAGILVDNSIMLVGPVNAAGALAASALKAEFWKTVAWSVARIGVGFLAGFCLGLGLAGLSFRFRLFQEILQPVMGLFKAVPVASFVVLLLIWWGSSFLAVAVSFLIVLPGIYISTLEGLKGTDRKMLEMAKVFHMPAFNKFFYIYRPALKPFLDGSLKVAVGMSWKSGVAAEVIGTPDYSIGERLYLSKIYLDTAGVLAWTAVIILLSWLFEKLVLKCWEIYSDWQPRCAAAAVSGNCKNAGRAAFIGVSKRFGEQVILKRTDAQWEQGGIYFLTGPSGSGKTTILKLLAGLETPDEGQVEGTDEISMVFQEDRLCEAYSAVKNLEMITGNASMARKELEKLLAAEALDKPCGQLSGGMKRRVAVVRALTAASNTVLLDEPFTGLDGENRQRTVEYILENRRGRTFLIASHHREELEMTGGKEWRPE